MPDVVDVGNDKAFAIREDQLRRHSTTHSNIYVIAYCSGDGSTLEVVDFSGTKHERFDYMEKSLGIDPVKTNNWAIAQWSYDSTSWTILAGDGQMEKQLREHLAKSKQRPR